MHEVGHHRVGLEEVRHGGFLMRKGLLRTSLHTDEGEKKTFIFGYSIIYLLIDGIEPCSYYCKVMLFFNFETTLLIGRGVEEACLKF